MNIIQLCTDYNIPYITEGKHCVPGWINLCCPSCGDSSFHMGYNLKDNYVHCWRCGWKPLTSVFSKLLNLSETKTWGILQEYGQMTTRKVAEPTITIRLKAHKFPSGTGPLNTFHKKYLIERQFDPDKLEREWNLVGTGPVSHLDNIDFRQRIIAPIIWNGQQVSFQGRDITKKHDLRYITCPKEREIIHHKHILYGRQELWSDTGICCEGITDVWRMGARAFATFGIKFTNQQVRVIAQNFKRVAVLFDDEPQARSQANELVSRLKFRNVDAWRIDIVGDPGSMKQEDADYLVKQIGR